MCVRRTVCHARFAMEDMHATFNVKALSAMFICLCIIYTLPMVYTALQILKFQTLLLSELFEM